MHIQHFSLFSYWFEGTFLISPNLLNIDKNCLCFFESRYSSFYSGFHCYCLSRNWVSLTRVDGIFV